MTTQKQTLPNWTKAAESQVLAGAFWLSLRANRMNVLARKYTAAASLADLCELGRASNYRPSIPCNSTKDEDERRELTELANSYDAFQAARGDERRAYRR